MNQSLKTVAFLIFSFIGTLFQVAAQEDFTVHFLKNVPQSHLLRPGKMPPMEGFFLFPGLAGGSVGWNNNSFTFPQLNVDWGSRTVDPDYNALFDNIRDLGKIGFRANIPIFAVGIQAKNSFITFDMTDRLEGNGYFAFDYVTLNQVEDFKNYQAGRFYDLSDINLSILHYRSYNVGFTYQVNQNISVGGKVGYTAGLENIWTENNGLTLTELGNGLFLVDGEGLVHSSGIGRLEGEEEFNAGTYLFNFTNPGIVASLGATFRPIKKLELHGGFYNLGFVNWKNDIGGSATVSGEIINIEDRLDTIYVDLKEEDEPLLTDYQTGLPAHIFLSGEYFYNDAITFGGLFETYFARGKWFVNTSISSNFQVKNWLAATVNYSIINNDFTSIGTGLSVNLGPVQLYATTDNVLGLFAQGKNIHFSGGLNFVFGTKPYFSDPETALREQFEIDESPVSTSDQPEVASKSNFKFTGVVLSSDKTTEIDEINIDVYQRYEAGNLEKVYSKKVKKNTFNVALDPDGEYFIWLESDGFKFTKIKLEKNPSSGKIPTQKTIYMDPEGFEGEKPAPDRNDGKVDKSEIKEEEIFNDEKMRDVEEKTETPEKITPPKEVEKVKEPVAEPEKPALPEVSIGDELTVNTATILQDAPNEGGKSIARFFPGDKVELLEKTSSKWWRVKFKKNEGWIKAEFLKK